MSKSLARAVVAFAELVSGILPRPRRLAVMTTAAEYLARTVPVETRRGKLLFHCPTRRALHYPWHFHDDEPDTLAWIDEFPPDTVFWDIGANVGQFALYAALRPAVRVLAFEPAGASYAALVRNVEINRLDERLLTYPIAFSDKTALDTLNMATTEAGSSMHAFGETINAYDREIDIRFRQAAVGFAIDDFVRIFDPPRPTHIKIDVDSIEARVIRGGLGLFGDGGVRSVWVEVMGSSATPRNAEILATLKAVGFEALPKRFDHGRNMEFRRQ